MPCVLHEAHIARVKDSEELCVSTYLPVTQMIKSHDSQVDLS